MTDDARDTHGDGWGPSVVSADARSAPATRVAFALGMIALGVMGLALRNFKLIWGPVPGWVPGLTTLVSVCAVVPLAAGVALLFRRGAPVASRVLLVYVALWWLLIKAPTVVEHPLTEMSWLAAGMNGILLAGAWTLFADVGGWPPRDSAASTESPRSPRSPRFAAGEGGLRTARALFGLALIPVGLSHFAYTNLTTPLIPSWIPWHLAWAYFTGACHIAAGLGVLFGVLPRLAAWLEATMLGLFTLLVWVPRVVSLPDFHRNWTELWVSAALTAASAVVAARVPAYHTPGINRRRVRDA